MTVEYKIRCGGSLSMAIIIAVSMNQFDVEWKNYFLGTPTVYIIAGLFAVFILPLPTWEFNGRRFVWTWVYFSSIVNESSYLWSFVFAAMAFFFLTFKVQRFIAPKSKQVITKITVFQEFT